MKDPDVIGGWKWGTAAPIVYPTLADGINMWPTAVLTFNHPLGVQIICLSFAWILRNVNTNIFAIFDNSGSLHSPLETPTTLDPWYDSLEYHLVSLNITIIFVHLNIRKYPYKPKYHLLEYFYNPLLNHLILNIQHTITYPWLLNNP